MLVQAIGTKDISPSDLIGPSHVDFDAQFSRRFRVSVKAVDMNRQWRVIYFSPDYSFDAPGIVEYLTKTYYQGMDMYFYEYRVARSSQRGPWLLGWRRITNWLDKEKLRKSFSKSKQYETWQWWNSIWHLLDRFVSGMAREGYIVKKMPGGYATWFVIEPDLHEVEVNWPNKDTRDLSTGSISIPVIASHCPDIEDLKRGLGTIEQEHHVRISHRLKQISRRYPIGTFSSYDNRLKIEWQVDKGTGEQCVEIACRVVSRVVSWYKGD